MRQFGTLAAAAAVVCVGLISVSKVSAQVTLFDSGGFSAPAYALGNLGGQNGWINDPAASTRFQVVDIAGNQLVRAAGGTNGNSNTSWVFPDATYTPGALEQVVIEADIARGVGATAATSSFGWFVDVYGLTGTRTFRFGLGVNGMNQPVIIVTSRFNATTQLFDPTGPVANLIVSGPIAVNAFVSLKATADYTTKSFTLSANGTDLGLGFFPFVDLATTGIGDADLQVSSAAGRLDVGFFDNYKVSTVIIPEPSALGLLAPAGLVLARRRRA